MSLNKLKKKFELTNDVPMQDYTVKNRWIAEVKNKDLLKAVLPLLREIIYSKSPDATAMDLFDEIEELLEENK